MMGVSNWNASGWGRLRVTLNANWKIVVWRGPSMVRGEGTQPIGVSFLGELGVYLPHLLRDQQRALKKKEKQTIEGKIN